MVNRIVKVSFTLVLAWIVAAGSLWAQVPGMPQTHQEAPNDTAANGGTDGRKPFLKDVFSGNIGYSIGRTAFTDTTTNSNRYEIRHSPRVMLNIRLYKELSFSTTAFVQLNDKAVFPWTADFFYSLKWFNWRPRTFSYGYENYVNNKYTDSGKDLYEKFLQGFFFVSYNHPLPQKWIDKIRIDESTNFTLVYMLRYSARFIDEDMVLQDGGWGKLVPNLSARYTIGKRFYVEGGVNYYINPQETKLPWDPDFTYGFGYFDWRPWRVSVTYGNWVVNRFPWNEKEVSPYGFWEGDLNILFNFKF
jgi:hypothetical protein